MRNYFDLLETGLVICQIAETPDRINHCTQLLGDLRGNILKLFRVKLLTRWWWWCSWGRSRACVCDKGRSASRRVDYERRNGPHTDSSRRTTPPWAWWRQTPSPPGLPGPPVRNVWPTTSILPPGQLSSLGRLSGVLRYLQQQEELG